MHKLLTVVILGIPWLLIAAEPELRGSPTELSTYLASVPKIVSIVGDSEQKVPADKAVMSLKVTTENKSFQEALHANQEVRSKLVAFLKKAGIPADRVKASRFSSTPKFGWFSEKAKSFRVENLVKVTVLDEKEFQAAASAVDAWPEVQFVGADFELEGKEAMKQKVLADACNKAADRGKVYEEQLGLKLVPARFSGGEVLQKSPATVGNYLVGGYSTAGKRSAPDVASLQTGAEAGAESVSSFGELVFTAQVTVEYTVQGK
jgi:uncharacterized protein YggE